MRKWANQLFRWYHRFRYKQIEYFMEHPHEVQHAVWEQLIRSGKDTEWGRRFGYSTIRTPKDFSSSVPVQDYESLKPFILRMMHGEKDVLWPGRIRWFSKSSGTTSDKSKFIPVSRQHLWRGLLKATSDTMSVFYHNRPDASQFEHKSMVMGGSLQHFEPYPKTIFGDVSAIMIRNMPAIAHPFYFPDLETALLSDWEIKLERLAQAAVREPDVVMIGGVPTWTVVLFRRMLEITGKTHILEIWPKFQVYIHGGVSFTPYRKQFEAFFPSPQVAYQEVYNASEGYFAVQNDLSSDDLLLLLNHGIYYEFLPMEEWDKQYPEAIPLTAVETGKNYALVISTNSGLWRYVPGDTILFTSVYPYKIKIMGRTKQFVNAFGEEVMVENTDRALAETCSALNATATEYTVAPIYFEGTGKGGHDWLIEFEKPPQDLERFRMLLDANLQKVNSDYEAKRFRDMALESLHLRPVPMGTFHRWLRAKGKFGGQHKVPRLANHRRYIDEILGFLSEKV